MTFLPVEYFLIISIMFILHLKKKGKYPEGFYKLGWLFRKTLPHWRAAQVSGRRCLNLFFFLAPFDGCMHRIFQGSALPAEGLLSFAGIHNKGLIPLVEHFH